MRPPDVALAALLILAVAACSTQAQADPPTSDEAQAFLDELVVLAQQGDFAGLCDLAGDGNCERKLDEAGRDRVPAAAPRVERSELLPTTAAGDQTSVGGRVVVLSGVDALGAPYESEMLVFRDREGTMRAINPAYWGGYRIGRDAAAAGSKAATPRTNATAGT